MQKSQKTKSPEGYVPKGTLYGVAAVCAAAGFLAGIVFSALKSVPNLPANQPGVSREAQAPAAPSGEALMRIKTLEAETAKNPGKGEVWAELGNAFFDAGQPDKAIQAYEKSLALIPDNADVITDMGVMYRRMGQPEKAVAAFERAMEVDSKHEISRYNKGIVLLHDLNDTDGAIRAWEDLIRINPGYTTPTGQTVKQLVDVYKNRREAEAGADPGKKP